MNVHRIEILLKTLALSSILYFVFLREDLVKTIYLLIGFLLRKDVYNVLAKRLQLCLEAQLIAYGRLWLSIGLLCCFLRLLLADVLILQFESLKDFSAIRKHNFGRLSETRFLKLFNHVEQTGRRDVRADSDKQYCQLPGNIQA